MSCVKVSYPRNSSDSHSPMRSRGRAFSRDKTVSALTSRIRESLIVALPTLLVAQKAVSSSTFGYSSLACQAISRITVPMSSEVYAVRNPSLSNHLASGMFSGFGSPGRCPRRIPASAQRPTATLDASTTEEVFCSAPFQRSHPVNRSRERNRRRQTISHSGDDAGCSTIRQQRLRRIGISPFGCHGLSFLMFACKRTGETGDRQDAVASQNPSQESINPILFE
jgi:hypothetical protein